MDQIDELKQMQNFPRFYLSNYFDELKNEIDLKYAVEQDEQVKYLEIIKNIESFEQEAYKKCKSFNTFDKEIKSIEDKLNDSNLNEITQLIDELKYKIEKEIFLNKSIFFYEKERDYAIDYDDDDDDDDDDNDDDDGKKQKKCSTKCATCDSLSLL
jgi:hypothetical protein